MTEESGRPWWAFGCSPDLTPRDFVNMRRWTMYLMLTMFSFLGVVLAMSSGLVSGSPALLLTLIPVAFGVQMFRAAGRFLREADELTRRIQVDALAVGFGAGFAASVLQEMALEATEMMGWQLEVADLFNPIVWMCLGYGISVSVLQRRYCG